MRRGGVAAPIAAATACRAPGFGRGRTAGGRGAGGWLLTVVITVYRQHGVLDDRTFPLVT